MVGELESVRRSLMCWIHLQTHFLQWIFYLTNFYNSSSPYVVTRHMEGTKVVKRYSCCEEPYISLNFRSNQSKLIVNVSFDQGLL